MKCFFMALRRTCEIFLKCLSDLTSRSLALDGWNENKMDTEKVTTWSNVEATRIKPVSEQIALKFWLCFRKQPLTILKVIQWITSNSDNNKEWKCDLIKPIRNVHAKFFETHKEQKLEKNYNRLKFAKIVLKTVNWMRQLKLRVQVQGSNPNPSETHLNSDAVDRRGRVFKDRFRRVQRICRSWSGRMTWSVRRIFDGEADDRRPEWLFVELNDFRWPGLYWQAS